MREQLALRRTLVEAGFDALITDFCTPILAVLAALEPQIAVIETKIQEFSEVEPMTKFLMTAPGVGLLVASMFVSVVDDAQRFRTAHQLEGARN